MHEKLREHIEKIVPLTDEEFAVVSSHFSVRNYKKRTFLFREEDAVLHVYFVVSGLVMLVHNDDQGKQHIISFAMEDWWETDFLAFYTQTRATLSLQCLEDTQVLCLSLPDYQTLCGSLPKMEHFFLAKSIAGHIGSQQRILSFLTSSAQQRYEQLLSRYPSLFQRVPKTLLASYLGISRETLSRLSR